MEYTDVDWEAVERSPEFRELVRRRNRFIYPATIFFLAWFIGFILLAGYAPEFMGESVYEGLTVGYVLALTQFLMVWGLSWLYLRRATDEFDPLRERAMEAAQEFVSQPTAGREPDGRFQRAPGAATAPAATAVVPDSPAPTAPTRTGGAS